MSNETIKDQVRRLIAGIAPCYEKRPDLIKDDDYCFGFMVQVVELAIAEEREANAVECDNLHQAWRWDNEADSESGPRQCAKAIRQRSAPKDEVNQ